METNKEQFQQVKEQDVVHHVLNDAARCIQHMPADVLYGLGCIMSKYISNGNKILITGIGKPSFVAQKCAATLKSIRVNAEYLDAITAGHGDLGSIKNDEKSLLIMLSKSGKSTELRTLCENIHKCCPMTAVILLTMTSDTKSVEQIYAGIGNMPTIISLEVEPAELDGFGIIPSTSNAMFEMGLSAAIAVAMRNVGNKDIKDLLTRLQLSHPSGSLHNKVTKLLANIQNEQ